MPTATGLQFNFSSVAHGTITINHVTDVTFTQAIQLQSFFGDTGVYAQVVAAHSGKVTIQVISGNVGTLMGITPGTIATFTATHKDAQKASGGDLSYTVVNAVAGQCNATGTYGQFGKATMTLEAFSADGITNPISIAMT